MDDLELIARVTSHIPDKGQFMVRDYINPGVAAFLPPAFKGSLRGQILR